MRSAHPQQTLLDPRAGHVVSVMLPMLPELDSMSSCAVMLSHALKPEHPRRVFGRKCRLFRASYFRNQLTSIEQHQTRRTFRWPHQLLAYVKRST